MREYGKIKSSFWTNSKIRSLSERGRSLLLYIYSCPHGNSIGCFVLPSGYICEDMGWDNKLVSELVSELVSKGFIDRDENTRLTRIKSWWEHNSIENLNVAKSAVKTLAMLPKCEILNDVIQELKQTGNKFINELSNSFGNEFPNPEREPKPEPEPELEMEKGNGPHPFQIAFEEWNILATELGLQTAAKLTTPRKSKLKARLNDCGGLEGWHTALGKIRASPFLLGQNDRGWKADFDFVLQEKSFTKLMEGSYDAIGPNNKSKQGDKPRLTPTERIIAAALHGNQIV